MRENWDASAKAIVNEKELSGKVGKMGETKKAMPFIMAVKKRLLAGEDETVVLERKLAFDEQAILLEMVSGLKRTTGFATIVVVAVSEGSKKGKDLTDGGKEVDVTNPVSGNAVPGTPSFLFENVEEA